MNARAIIIAATFACLASTARAASAGRDVNPSELARPVRAVTDDGALEAEAREVLRRLLALSPIAGPEPTLVFSDDPAPRAKTQQATITITRRLLRLCSVVGARPGGSGQDGRSALIAFVLAHELAHFVRRDAGSFGTREASEAVERDADEQAVRRLFMAGVDLQHLRLEHLLRAIARESGRPTSSATDERRTKSVRRALANAQRASGEAHFGWLLTVAGRFDHALPFYENIAATYPYPVPMYALALTRLQAAWRSSPCDDPALLEWLPPIRYDPRAQIEPFKVRSPNNACAPLRSALATAAVELAQAPDHVSAQIALASIRLMQGDPTLDPTRAIGGVARIGDACPASTENSLQRADACHVSLLSQYEMSRRSPEARDAAIAGLKRLSEHWPTEPSLKFNLARLSAAAQRPAEAVSLWKDFLANAAPGPYRSEAEEGVSRLSPDAPTEPALSVAGSLAPVLAENAERLALLPKACRLRARWRPLPLAGRSSWTYCGEWSDEVVIRRARETVIRSIAIGTRLPRDIEPPWTAPLFVTTNSAGEELRIWDEEAWTFRGKEPQRVVYFKKPPR